MATDVTAPMFGTVISVSVKPGDQVKENQSLIVFESMNMQMDIVAPVAGTIKEIKVAPNQAIQAEQLLATIE